MDSGKRERISRMQEPVDKTRAENEPSAELLDWIQTETRSRELEEGDNPNVTLEPADRFPTTPHFRHPEDEQTLGREAEGRMIRGLIAGKCCGWPERPSVDEVHRTMRSRAPTTRDRAIAETVITEATISELAQGEQEGSYCLQDLAWWMHLTQTMPARKVRWLNRCIGIGAGG